MRFIIATALFLFLLLSFKPLHSGTETMSADLATPSAAPEPKSADLVAPVALETKSADLATPSAELAPKKSAPQVSVYPDQIVQGEFAAVLITNYRDGMTVVGRLGNDPLSFFRISEDRLGALAGVDVSASSESRELNVEIFCSSGIRIFFLETDLTVKSGTFVEQSLRVAPNFVSLSQEDQQRAGREARLRRQIISESHRASIWENPFIVPLDGRISSTFGARRLFNGQLRSVHNGVDIAAPTGTPVMASNSGMVVLVNDFFYAGKCVYIDHGNSLHTAYLHLSSASVNQGDWVEQGDIIGKVGATGRVTGPHLHWSAFLYGQNIDPHKLLDISEYFVSAQDKTR